MDKILVPPREMIRSCVDGLKMSIDNPNESLKDAKNTVISAIDFLYGLISHTGHELNKSSLDVLQEFDIMLICVSIKYIFVILDRFNIALDSKQNTQLTTVAERFPGNQEITILSTYPIYHAKVVYDNITLESGSFSIDEINIVAPKRIFCLKSDSHDCSKLFLTDEAVKHLLVRFKNNNDLKFRFIEIFDEWTEGVISSGERSLSKFLKNLNLQRELVQYMIEFFFDNNIFIMTNFETFLLEDGNTFDEYQALLDLVKGK